MNHDTFLLHEFHGRFALLIVEKISDHTTPQKIIRGPHKSFVFFQVTVATSEQSASPPECASCIPEGCVATGGSSGAM